jgi:hypothetical protein
MNASALWLIVARSLLVTVLCLVRAGTAHGQGTVLFDNHVPGAAISHVYLPLPASPGFTQTGNGTADYPSGTTDWTGWAPVSGDGFSAQLFAAPGADAPVSSLAPALPSTTFRTGDLAGFVNPVTATLTGVPFFTPIATIQVRVWDNRGGTVPDWVTAIAQPPGTELVGMSAPVNLTGIDGGFPAIPPLLVGLQSFNLAYIPEPSSLGLAGLGAIALLIAWLMKKANGTSSKRL